MWRDICVCVCVFVFLTFLVKYLSFNLCQKNSVNDGNKRETFPQASVSALRLWVFISMYFFISESVKTREVSVFPLQFYLPCSGNKTFFQPHCCLTLIKHHYTKHLSLLHHQCKKLTSKTLKQIILLKTSVPSSKDLLWLFFKIKKYVIGQSNWQKNSII